MKARAKGTGSIFRPKGSKYYWVAYVSGGKRRYESTKSIRRSDAQKLLTTRLGDVAKGIVVTPKLGRVTLAEALKAVINDQTVNGRANVAHTQRQINKHILACPAEGDEPARGYFIPDRRLSTITTSDLTAYVAHRLAQGAAPASVDHELATIRRAFRLALRAGEIATMPYVPMLALNNTRKGFFERDEFERIRAALPDDVRGLVTFAYVTGWRIKSEVLPLTWAQVDRRAQTIRLEPGTTKNREGRTIPYGEVPELIEVVQAQWSEHERLRQAGVLCPFVFQRRGQRIQSFRGSWHAACRVAGVRRVPHDFRRTAVRNFERAGVSRSAAMKITGHKTESVYRRYAIVSEGDLRDGFRKLVSAQPTTTERSAEIRPFDKSVASR